MAWHFKIKMSCQNKGAILAFKKIIKMPNIFGDIGILKKIKMPNIRNGIDGIRKIVWSAREL